MCAMTVTVRAATAIEIATGEIVIAAIATVETGTATATCAVTDRAMCAATAVRAAMRRATTATRARRDGQRIQCNPSAR